MARICANCGHPIGETDAFCLQCGVRVANPSVASEQSMGGMTSFCPECGKRVKPHWSFCMNCGRQLGMHKDAGSSLEKHVSIGKTVMLNGLPGSVTSQKLVSTRAVNVGEFDEAASLVFNEDEFESWEIADTSAPYDDVPTETFADSDDDDSPTMIYEEERPRECVLTRTSTGEVYKLKLPAKIGRGNAADVRIGGNPYIGRVHACVWERDGEVYVRDEESANHTYVNGEIVSSGQEVAIKTGDTISLAKEEFLVSID